MPLSKKRRRKNGKKVDNGDRKNLHGHNQRVKRFADQESAVSLQDLINVLAYQEYEQDGTIVDGKAVDFEDPNTQAIIKAVDSIEVGDPDMVDGIGYDNNQKEHD